MILYHLKVENFRGIKTLDWHTNGRVLCLIGPNDSAKTTILEAIELAALPRYNAAFGEVDFHNSDVTKKIVVEATFGDLPPELLDEIAKYGLFLRGYDTAAQAIVPAPINGVVPALTVRFELDASLEPVWSVVTDTDAKRITWQDRERLGVNYLGRDIDRHLTWGRGSALSKLTDKTGAPTGQVVAMVSREANRLFASTPQKELSDAAIAVQTEAAVYGAFLKDLKPGLDVAGLSFASSAFALRDGAVPSRLWGLGTRRIASLATQQKGVGIESILMIDEIETGLEPHRVRHLVDCLYRPSQSLRDKGQILFTTHSPSSVIPLPVEHIRFVRNESGEITVRQVSPGQDKMQGYARSHAHALFARKILVCEGATEEGICRGLIDHWCEGNGGLHPTHFGFVAVNGNGNSVAPSIAVELKRLGYSVAVLADDDVPINPSAGELNALGIPTFIWDGKMAVENRIAADMPLNDLQAIVDLAISEHGEASVLSQLDSHGGVKVEGREIKSWCILFSEDEIRKAIGTAAKKGGKGWFKNISSGIELGRLIGGGLRGIPDAPLSKTLAEVADWIYGRAGH